MPTIVNKNTGAGFLRDREVMASFLAEIFLLTSTLKEKALRKKLQHRSRLAVTTLTL
mgnify:CR=1 FL=1